MRTQGRSDLKCVQKLDVGSVIYFNAIIFLTKILIHVIFGYLDDYNLQLIKTNYKYRLTDISLHDHF